MGFLAFMLAAAALFWAYKLSRRVAELENELRTLSAQHSARGELRDGKPAEARAPQWTTSDTSARPQPASHVTQEPIAVEPKTAASAAPEAPAPHPKPSVAATLPPRQPAPVDAGGPQNARVGRGWNFEDLFGRRLPVWGGGIALALAGFFLVKYSIDTGLMTPAVRSLLGLLFGLGLIGGAEAARRIARLAADPRMAQALAGAGIATLYGVIYMTTSLYGLIAPGLGFAGMACVTAIALALSLRHGAPAAVLGLLGGFSTPVLVNTSEGSVPALLGYLLLTIGGLLGVARVREWRWLGMLALAGGFGWSGVLLAADLIDTDMLAVGFFLMLLALGALLMLGADRKAAPSRRDILVPGAAAAMAFVQLAVLIGKGGFGWTEWGLYALLAAAVTVLAVRDIRHQLLPPAALAIALFTFAAWPDPGQQAATLVAAGIVLLFAGPGYLMATRPGGRLVWAAQATAATIVTAVLLSLQVPNLLSDISWALLYLILAIPAVWAAWGTHRQIGIETTDARRALFLSAAAILAALAAFTVLPVAYLPVIGMSISAGLAYLAMRWRDIWLGRATAVAVGAAALAVSTAPADLTASFTRLIAGPTTTAVADGLLCFLLPALLLGGIAWWEQQDRRRIIYTLLAVLLLVLGAVQIVPSIGRPVALALLAAALLEAARLQIRLSLRKPALAVIGLALLWAVPPIAFLLGDTLLAILGTPLLTTELPEMQRVLWHLLLPGLVLGATAWRYDWPQFRQKLVGYAVPAVLVLSAGFIIYKRAWGVANGEAFIAHGFAERIVLTQMLFAAGAAAYAVAPRMPLLLWLARALTALAAIRLVWFDMLVFNPLVQAQSVGGWPLINLLPVAYGLPVYWLARTHANEPLLKGHAALVAKGASIAGLILLVGLAVRQIFHGSVLTEGQVGTAEHYAYSAAGLVTAIGLLLWGAWRQDQLTRIASLALMLATIGKVFLMDAAALEGLWRIASFVGLGLSLIGISWFYTRYVFARQPAAEING